MGLGGKKRISSGLWLPLVVLAGGGFFPSMASAQGAAKPLNAADAIRLSSFGERASFSPDGKRIVFVGKSYGDAYEIDIATREIRNITAHVPHQGILRIQYLPNGDYLVTAPARYIGPNTRAKLQMWVLDRELKKGLQPLSERPFEGIAVSRRKNLIAWTSLEPELSFKAGQSWMDAFNEPTKRYVAEISYDNGVPHIINKREIIPKLPKECGFIEPQDFRENDGELVFTCASPASSDRFTSSVMGYNIANGTLVTYRRQIGEYNEAEGIAPDGSWSAVECGVQKGGEAIPPLDICKLELKPGGKSSQLIVGTASGTTQKVSNPVVSPDARWISFQKADASVGEVGEGLGIYLLKVSN